MKESFWVNFKGICENPHLINVLREKFKNF